MADQDVRFDQSKVSGDELEVDAQDEGTHGVPSEDAGGSPTGSGDPPPSGATGEHALGGDPKDGPLTVADDGGVGGEGLVGAGGNGGGDGGGGPFGGLADGAQDLYDDVEEEVAETYDDAEEEVAETYDDASKLDHQGEHWGGVAGTPDEAVGAVLDTVDPNHHLEDFNRGTGDFIDDTARDAGDTFRDAGDVVNELYDDSGAEDVIDGAREAGAVVVPDVVEDVYDQGEDLTHQTYDDVVEEVVETYEDASHLQDEGEHWGGLAGTPDHWVEPLVDGAENVGEMPGDWYEKSGVEDLGFGTGAVDGTDPGDVPDVDDHGRGGFGTGAPDPLAPDEGVTAADEPAELAGEEEALRLTAEVDDLAADPGPIEVPVNEIALPESSQAPDPIEPEATGHPDEVDPALDLIDPI
jgi:hypothetical protein